MIQKVVVNWWALHEGTDRVSCNVAITDDTLGLVHRDIELSDAALCALRGEDVDDWNSAEIRQAVAQHYGVSPEIVTSCEPQAEEG